MAYNLLLDTEFTNNNWNYINCEMEDGYIVSKGKVFGVEQEIILTKPKKLYCRFEYQVESENVNNVMIGIQNGEILNVNKKTPKVNKHQQISMVEETKEGKIKLHLIFEASEEINKVKIEKPILADLDHMKKTTWAKWRLDLAIKYRKGYVYKNLYECSELKPDIKDLKDLNLEEGKIGSIIKTQDPINIKISAKFIEKKYYLVKLDYEEINKMGSISLSYGNVKVDLSNSDEQFILFKGSGDNKLEINITPNDILPYILNLKHILIIQAGGMNLMRCDIPYLMFI